jgi:hypothetical protein
MTGIPLAPVRRDNGRWYRPRTISCAAVHDEDANLTAVIVFGTHDAVAVRPLAQESIGYWLGPDYEACVPIAGWWRDTILRGDRTWAPDPIRGRAGIWFDVAEREYAVVPANDPGAGTRKGTPA